MQKNPYEAGELNSEDAGVSAEKLRLRLIPMQIIAGVLASGVVFFLGVALVMIEGELNTGMGMLVQLGVAMAVSAVVMHTVISARQPTEKQLREYVEAGEPMQSLLGFFQQRLIVSLAMKTPASNFMLRVPFPRNRIGAVLEGNRFVEACFQCCHQRNLRESLLQLTHRSDVGRIVCRSDVGQVLHLLQQRFIHNTNTAHASGKDCFESDAADLINRLQAAMLWICQLLQTDTDRSCVIRDNLIQFLSLITDLSKA
jgi:hypothetical protein